MTELLQKAFAEAARLPEEEQDKLAKTLLGDLVKLVPKSSEKKPPQFGSAKGSVQMSDDFDEPLPDFAEYME
jgi:hypothetical protein